jgi:hypothetical protein
MCPAAGGNAGSSLSPVNAGECCPCNACKNPTCACAQQTELLSAADTPGSRHHSFLLASSPSAAADLHPPIEASDEDDWEDDEQSLLTVGRQPSYGTAGGRAASSSSSPSYSLGRALAGLRLQQLWHSGEAAAGGREGPRAAAAAGVSGGAVQGVQVLPDAGLPLEQGVAEAAARHRR